jgi:hypothetical protein
MIFDITPQDFVDALRRFIGVPHSAAGSFIVETPTGPRGFLKCAGLPLAALRCLGYLPADFVLDQSDAQLVALLKEHFNRVEQIEVGDLFFLRIENSTEKHLAVCTDTSGLGSMIHCLNDVRGIGRVWECHLDQGALGAIEGIYRLKIWGGDSHR